MKTIVCWLVLACSQKPHTFYDRPARIELGAAIVAASVDTGITCKNLANGGRELWLPTQRCRNVGLILVGQVAGQELVVFALHKLKIHKLERLGRLYTIEENTHGIEFSLRH